MSCKTKIHQCYGRLTTKEKMVADYILEHIEEIPSLSIQELSKRSQSSTGAVMRLARKMGFSGYPMLKIEIAKAGGEEEDQQDVIIQRQDTPEIIAQKLRSHIEITVSNTQLMADFKNIQECIERLHTARRIFILGVDGSAISAIDLQQKLMRINKNVVYNQDSHMQMRTSAMSTPEDIVIAFSYSGETDEILYAVKKHKENHAFVMGITKSVNNTLSKLCDCVCYIPNTEDAFHLESVSSRYAQLYITDIIYLMLTKKESENIQKTYPMGIE